MGISPKMKKEATKICLKAVDELLTHFPIAMHGKRWDELDAEGTRLDLEQLKTFLRARK